MLLARPTHGGLIFLLLTCAAGGVAFMNVGLMTALCASILAGIWISAFFMAQFSFLFIRLERLSAADAPGKSFGRNICSQSILEIPLYLFPSFAFYDRFRNVCQNKSTVLIVRLNGDLHTHSRFHFIKKHLLRQASFRICNH